MTEKGRPLIELLAGHWPETIKEQRAIARKIARDAVPRAGRGDWGSGENARYRESLEVCGYYLRFFGNTKAELMQNVIARLMDGRPIVES